MIKFPIFITSIFPFAATILVFIVHNNFVWSLINTGSYTGPTTTEISGGFLEVTRFKWPASSGFGYVMWFDTDDGVQIEFSRGCHLSNRNMGPVYDPGKLLSRHDFSEDNFRQILHAPQGKLKKYEAWAYSILQNAIDDHVPEDRIVHAARVSFLGRPWPILYSASVWTLPSKTHPIEDRSVWAQSQIMQHSSSADILLLDNINLWGSDVSALQPKYSFQSRIQGQNYYWSMLGVFHYLLSAVSVSIVFVVMCRFVVYYYRIRNGLCSLCGYERPNGVRCPECGRFARVSGRV